MNIGPAVLNRREAVAALAAFAAGSAAAQAFPTRPVTLLVPYAAGGSADGVARMVGERLGARLGQTIVIDNKPGANGLIATQQAVQAAPDGYTLLFSVAAAAAMNPSLYSQAAELQKRLVPVSKTTSGAFAVLVNNDLPVRSFPDLLAHARSHPGVLTYASAGNGSHAHLAAAMLCSMAGLDMLHVPYKGGGAVMPDLMSGTVQVFFDTIGSSLPFVQAGKVRALAVTSAQRSPIHPSLPAIAEYIKGYQTEGWHGVFAPVATPPATVQRLGEAIAAAVRSPELSARLGAIGFTAIGNTPAEFGRELAQETRTYAELIKAIHLRVE